MSSPAGRDRLLDAAERLFAEQGIEATSARAINAAADLSPAALHYHFGNKERVIEEVLHRRIGELGERRTEMVADVLAKGLEMDSKRLVEMVVLPQADFALGPGKPGRWYIRFIARLFTEKPQLMLDFVEASFGEGSREFDAMICAAAPSMDMAEAARRRWIAMETSTHCVAHLAELLSEEEDARVIAEPNIRSVVAFISAGMVAPLT